MKKLTILILVLIAGLCNAATTYLHVTVSGADTKDGTTWAKAMGQTEWLDHMKNTVVADTVYYIKSGTYTLGATYLTARPGAGDAPIVIIGVLSATTHEGSEVVESDYAYTTGRPLIEASAYGFTLSNYYLVYNIQCTTEYVNGFYTGTHCGLYNCKGTQSSAITKSALYLNNYSYAVKCEAISTNGYGFKASSGNKIISCYAHDSLVGIMSGAYTVLANSIIQTCGTGVNLASVDFCLLGNNTIWSCDVGIDATDSVADVFANNIISQCTDGAVWTTDEKSNLWLNNLMNNTDNEDLATQSVIGTNHLLDVGTQCLNDPANGDFRLTYSTARSAGVMVGVNDGLSVAGFHQNIGVDQTGDFPIVGNVTEDDYVDGVQGTYKEPTEAQVQDGVYFGALSVLLGTYVGEGGSSVVKSWIKK